MNAYPLLTLGAACELITDGSHFSPTITTEGYPYVTVRDVNNGVIDIGQCARISSEAFAQLAANGCQPRKGDVLFSKDGSIGRVAVVRGDRPFVVLSSLAILRPSQRLLLPEYLAYVLCGPAAQSQAQGSQSGTAIRRVVLRSLRKIRIPVPPLDEQRRIVDILEDHLSRLDAAIELLASAERRASAWNRSFVDATLWADQYPQIQVADLLAESMRNGHSARAVRDGLAGIRTLTLTAVTRNEFTDDFTKVTSADPDRVKRLWLRSGDLLVQRANTPQLVGTTAMYEGPDNWAIYPDLLIRLRANEQRVLGGYLCAAMRSERAHRQLRSKAKGLAGSMPKIDQAAIGSTTVPVPDMDTQQGLLLQLNEVQSVRERTTQAAKAAGSRAQVLRKALLTAAFSGRLTGRTSDMEMVEEMAGV